MPTQQHSTIADADRHQPKGLSTASAGMVYVCTGADTGIWKYIPHSFCYYSDIGTGTTYTTPTAYTLINPTTTGDGSPVGFTHNGAGRLTYTGTPSVEVSIVCNVCLKSSTGSGIDVYYALYKNGVAIPGGVMVNAANSVNYKTIVILAHDSFSTNDYVELYIKAVSGDIVIHAFELLIQGHA
jgi:hypothetical protein